MKKAKGKGGEGEAGGFFSPPRPMPLLPRALLGLVERRMGRPLVANRLLAWYPRAFWGSGILETLVAHDEPEVPARLLKLIRIQVSFQASCPFCIDLNAKEFRGEGITEEEILALRGLLDLGAVASLGARERAALAYARCATTTPVAYSPEVVEGLKSHFSERAIVVIASTAAQVNFWARLIQSLGVQPAGFSEECSILDLDRFRTMAGSQEGGCGHD